MLAYTRNSSEVLDKRISLHQSPCDGSVLRLIISLRSRNRACLGSRLCTMLQRGILGFSRLLFSHIDRIVSCGPVLYMHTSRPQDFSQAFPDLRDTKDIIWYVVLCTRSFGWQKYVVSLPDVGRYSLATMLKRWIPENDGRYS